MARTLNLRVAKTNTREFVFEEDEQKQPLRGMFRDPDTGKLQRVDNFPEIFKKVQSIYGKGCKILKAEPGHIKDFKRAFPIS